MLVENNTWTLSALFATDTQFEFVNYLSPWHKDIWIEGILYESPIVKIIGWKMFRITETSGDL